jgi:sarcosine oxidase/L-pipecolate oxidase
MKMAIHAPGYTNPIPLSSSGGEDDVVSVPRTKLTPGAEDGMIPREMLARLRSGLAEVYPDLQDREYVQTRLGW